MCSAGCTRKSSIFFSKWTSEFLPDGQECVEILGQLAQTGKFNYLAGDFTHGLALPQWLDSSQFSKASPAPERASKSFGRLRSPLQSEQSPAKGISPSGCCGANRELLNGCVQVRWRIWRIPRGYRSATGSKRMRIGERRVRQRPCVCGGAFVELPLTTNPAGVP